MTQSFSNFNSQLLRIALLCVAIAFAMVTKAQQDTAIVRTYGGPFYEEGKEIIECATGGYAIIGTTGSDQLNNTNFYLLRLDEELNCMWNKNYGGAEVEWGQSIVEDSNGNLLICGYTNSFGEGGYDILVYKVNDQGDIIWQKTYGGSDWDFGYKIIAHPSEGYLICGKTYSYGNGGSDGYLIHISDDGNLLNEWTFGGEGDDELVDMNFDNELRYIIGSGYNDSIGTIEAILLTFTDNSLLYQASYSFESSDTRANNIQTRDNGEILITANLFNNGTCSQRVIFRLDTEFIVTWLETSVDYCASCMVITPHSETIIAGTTSLFGLGGTGAFIERKSDEGYYVSSAAFGTSLDEDAYDLLLNSQGHVLMLGKSNGYSNNQDHSVYLVKFPHHEIVAEYHLQIEQSACFQVDINEEDQTAIFFYINDRKELTSTNPHYNFEFNVLDISGKQIINSSTNSLPIQLNNIPSGMYILVPVNTTLQPQKLMKL